MSLIGTHASKYDVPKIVMNTPVEVWREIIDHVLFDPVLYLTDPFTLDATFTRHWMTSRTISIFLSLHVNRDGSDSFRILGRRQLMHRR